MSETEGTDQPGAAEQEESVQEEARQEAASRALHGPDKSVIHG